MKNNKAVLWTVLLLALTIVVFLWLLRGADLAALADIVRHARPQWLAAGAILVFLTLFCQALCLSLLLGRCGQSPGLLACLRAVFTGFYFSGITPSASGGQAAQVWQLSRRGVAAGSSAGALLLMQIAYQVVMIALGTLGLLLCGGVVAGARGGMRFLIIYGFCAALLLFGLLFAALFSGARLERAGNRLILFLGRRRLVRDPDALCGKLHRQMEQFNACTALVSQAPLLSARILLVTLLQQLCLLSVPCAVYCALGLSGHPLWQLAAAQAVLSVAVDTLPLPGAVGASESAFIAVHGLFFGSMSLPAMMLSRSLSFYGAMAVSGLVTALPLPRKKAVSS